MLTATAPHAISTDTLARPLPIGVLSTPAPRRQRVGGARRAPGPGRPPNGQRPLAGGSRRRLQLSFRVARIDVAFATAICFGAARRTHGKRASVKRKRPSVTTRASAQSQRIQRTRRAPGNTRGRVQGALRPNTPRPRATRRAPSSRPMDAPSSAPPRAPAGAPPDAEPFLAPPASRRRSRRAVRAAPLLPLAPSPARLELETPKPAVAAVSGRPGPAGHYSAGFGVLTLSGFAGWLELHGVPRFWGVV